MQFFGSRTAVDRIFSRALCGATMLMSLTVLPAGRVAAEVATDADANVQQLIEQLGSPSFIQRQLATEALSSLGTVVLEPLRRASTSPDAEVRVRAREIIRVVRHDDRERVINAFIAGVDVGNSEQLPGWSAYREIVQEGEGARALYVMMLEEEWVFLDAVFEGEPANVPSLLERRLFALDRQTHRSKLTVGSVSALMLAAVRDGVQLPMHINMMSLWHRAPGFDAAIRSGESREPLRRLMGRLIAQPSASPYLHQSFHFALNYDLKEGLEPARRVITERVGIPYVRQYAIMVLAKLGDEHDLDLVQTMLDDEGVVTAHSRINRVRVTTQVRDVALAVLIHRSGGDFKAFGLDHVKPSPIMLIQPTSVGFATDQERQQALDKWAQRRD